MREKRIIPCLDVKDGRVVKGVGFGNLREIGDPLELAARYDADGADEIALLDIASKGEGRRDMLGLIARIAAKIRAPLIIGGGISSIDDMERVFDAGARKVSINTAAVREPELIERASARWGSGAIIVAIDSKRADNFDENPSWDVRIAGGERSVGWSVLDWAERVVSLGAGEILLTSVDRDGSLSGYDLELLRAVGSRVSVPIIASGGVGSLEDLRAGLEASASAVLAASIFHDAQHTIAEARAYLARAGIPLHKRPS